LVRKPSQPCVEGVQWTFEDGLAARANQVQVRRRSTQSVALFSTCECVHKTATLEQSKNAIDRGQRNRHTLGAQFGEHVSGTERSATPVQHTQDKLP
jgi:hypothetical protein